MRFILLVIVLGVAALVIVTPTSISPKQKAEAGAKHSDNQFVDPAVLPVDLTALPNVPQSDRWEPVYLIDIDGEGVLVLGSELEPTKEGFKFRRDGKYIFITKQGVFIDEACCVDEPTSKE